MAREFVSTLLASIGKRLEQHEFLAAPRARSFIPAIDDCPAAHSKIRGTSRQGTNLRNSCFWCWADRALEELIMKLLTKAVAGAAIGVGVLAASAVTASAAIVCSGNVCWHTHERYEYPATAGVVVHEDDWKWGPSEKYTFREHEGRGYWHGDTWTTW